jgi:hypothetical protein
MAVKVLITRQFREGKQKQAYKTLMELRSLATLQQGYMSGETLIGADDPNKLLRSGESDHVGRCDQGIYPSV